MSSRPRWSRRDFLRIGAVGSVASLAGCTDQPMERATVVVDNRDSTVHTITIWVVADNDLEIAETVDVDAESHVTVGGQLGPPLFGSTRYRTTVEVAGGTTTANAETVDGGFDTLHVQVDAADEIQIRYRDGG